MTTSINELSVNDIILIKQRVAAGEYQHVIAAEYGFNQGRVNEIVKDPKFALLTKGKTVPRKMQKVFRKTFMFTNPTP